jgi:hypothetical protein
MSVYYLQNETHKKEPTTKSKTIIWIADNIFGGIIFSIIDPFKPTPAEYAAQELQ